MENTVLEQENVTDNAESQERTFTQQELDEIIKSRIAKERSKYSDYETLQQKALKFDEMEEANKTELQKATEKAEALQLQIDAMNKSNEIRGIREKVANETGVPISLLLGETEEDCLAQATALLEFKNDNKTTYPSVKDGGEIANVPESNKSNGQLFGDWLADNLSK